MSIVRTLCCFLAGIIMAVPLSAQVSNISGRWQGALAVSGINLRIVLNVTETAGGVMSATMDSPDQGATGIPVNSIIVRNDSLLFTVEAVRGTYSGRFAPDRTTISGEWTQGSVRIPLEFRYTTEVIEQKRRQDPVKPYPYSEQEVTFSNPAAGITLAGTLTLPASEGPFPAVVLISGSGPQNRDGMILGHRPFLVIADYLTRRGIAVLRYDERGIGASTGDFSKANSRDLASDVQAAVDWLTERTDIDKRRIGLIGHSEGGLIAPMVAADDRDIAFLVLLAAPGFSGREILLQQSEAINRTAGMSSDLIAANSALQNHLYEAALRAADSADLHNRISAVLAGAKGKEKELIEADGTTAEDQVSVLLSPWFRFFLSYDPRPTLQKVSVPVLVLNGDKDLQVVTKNVKAVEQALQSGGNKAVTTRVLPGLNHLFQTTQTGLPAEYGTIEETFSPKALDIIGEWITARVRRK